MKLKGFNVVQFLGSLFPSESWLAGKVFLTDYDYAHVKTPQGFKIIYAQDWIVERSDGLEVMGTDKFEEEFGEIEELELTNREKATKANRTRVYCSCDRTMVNLTQKCPVCGDRVNRNKVKLKF